jgi:hypothetical protein
LVKWTPLVFGLSLLLTVVFVMVWAANFELFEPSETADLFGGLALASAVIALLSGIAAIVQAARDLSRKGEDGGQSDG